MTLHSGQRVSRVERPPAAKPGDRVGIAALSGRIDTDRLATGVAALEGLGFEPVLARNLLPEASLSGRSLFAGSDRERLEAFHELAGDESVAAIVFARGGYGVPRILEHVDWTLLASRPRPYIGYSDLTPLLLALVSRTGTMAFHGPMAVDFARGLLPEERRSFLDALAGRLSGPWVLERVSAKLSAGRPPAIEGRLFGGCLTMLAATVGTGLLPSFQDSILVLEDIDEPEYRIDRLLTQLRTSGQAAGVRAVIAGHFTNCDARASLVDFAEALDAPLFAGLPAGHQAPNHTLPLGAWARLDARNAILEVQG
ncbi:MAG: LD-carboxypeptidase [Acidobacteria bacterium]|nr:LD-carboxypeptidase [Acidobacteriota bacterium]MXZ38676.1 LD-carboxypeptidase [Holophagales bacterium]MYJ27005.1 LD-carboxypeptidase [Holophagales bacterium]